MSLEDNNKVVVKIFGEDYPITGVSDPSHISQIATFVDNRMNDIARTSRVKSRDKVAILATLSIASELHEKNEIIDHGYKEYESKLDSLAARLDDALSSAS
jgi:cell division protein ZapA